MPRLDREHIDTVLLVAAFLLGIVSIFMLKSYYIWLPALTSAGVIIAYAVITFKSGRARLEPDQIGDNAYYLGFVLTLTSLAYTLYGLEPQTMNRELIRDVLSGFGIALSSTIVGVIVRVALLQYRVDIVAREREARLQLNDAMRDFQVEITDVVRGTKYLGVEIRQSLNEHYQQMAEGHEQQAKKLMGDLLAGFQEVLKKFLEQSRETDRGLSESARSAISSAEKAVLETLNAVSGHLRESSVAINEDSRAAADALKLSLQETSKTISGSMDDLRTKVQSSVEEISSAHTENMKRVTALTGEAATSMQHATGSFVGKLEESLREVEKGIGGAADALKLGSQEANKMISGSMDDLRAEVGRSVEEISSAHAENMKHVTAVTGEAATSMQHATGSFARKLQESLSELETTMVKFSDASRRAREAMDHLTENLERVSKQVSENAGMKRRRFFRIFGRKNQSDRR